MSGKYLLRGLQEKLIFFQSKTPPYLSVNSYSPIFSERISFVGKSERGGERKRKKEEQGREMMREEEEEKKRAEESGRKRKREDESGRERK